MEQGGKITPPINLITTKQVPDDIAQRVPGEIVAGSEQRPPHLLSSINDLNSPIKHEGELANNLLVPDNLLHPQVIYSEEDEV